MAFSYTKTQESVSGDLREISGTFTNAGGSTGGDIRTGLQKVEGMVLQQGGAAVIASQPKVNETPGPLSDPITIVTAANATGWWWAFGY